MSDWDAFKESLRGFEWIEVTFTVGLTMLEDDLRNRFAFHPGTADTIPKHERVRDLCLALSLELNALVPDSREKSLAMTHLEDVMYQANAGIARHQAPVEERTMPTDLPVMETPKTTEQLRFHVMTNHNWTQTQFDKDIDPSAAHVVEHNGDWIVQPKHRH